MTPLTIFFGTFIILTIGFIIYTLRNQLSLIFWSPDHWKPVCIVEKAYKAIDIQHSFRYVMAKDFVEQRFFGYQNVIQSQQHKDSLIDSAVISIAREMAKRELIEITETQDWEAHGPFTKMVTLKVKVYKEDK